MVQPNTPGKNTKPRRRRRKKSSHHRQSSQHNIQGNNTSTSLSAHIQSDAADSSTRHGSSSSSSEFSVSSHKVTPIKPSLMPHTNRLHTGTTPHVHRNQHNISRVHRKKSRYDSSSGYTAAHAASNHKSSHNSEDNASHRPSPSTIHKAHKRSSDNKRMHPAKSSHHSQGSYHAHNAGGKNKHGTVINPASVNKSDRSNNRKYVVVQKEISAGGFIIRGFGQSIDNIEVALIGRIDRRGKLLWSIPKGHIESGETAEITAQREIQEETGLSGRVIGRLGIIQYSFVVEGRKVLKTVHHFLLAYDSGELSSEDPEVCEVIWVPLTDLLAKLTYADEKRLQVKAMNLLKKIDTSPDSISQLITDFHRVEPNEYEISAAKKNNRRNDPIATKHPVKFKKKEKYHRKRSKNFSE